MIVDDAISSGMTMGKVWDFLESSDVGAVITGAGVVMKQGERWRGVLGERKEKVRWVFQSPLLKVVEGGWDVRE